MKYILIYSYDIDESTSRVIEWLIKMNKSFVRLSDSIALRVKEIQLNSNETNIIFDYGKRQLETSLIESFWYRKGQFLTLLSLDKRNSSEINSYLRQEGMAIRDYFISHLDEKAPINEISKGIINKLKQLKLASECGLKVPETILTQNKKTLVEFAKKNKTIISKSIQAPFYFNDKFNSYYLMTNRIDGSDIKKIKEKFSMTKFQKEIEKCFEIRVFYLSGGFYSMAIFSQANKKTKIDFRNYDSEAPNRYVPYTLPRHIRAKLMRLMKKLELNSGSIDIIVDHDYNYWFLEVNPVGQFGMISAPCNYNLEKKIASKLLKKLYEKPKGHQSRRISS